MAQPRKGFLNKLIDKLPVELRLPGGYQYCGPGTRLKKRLALGQVGINPLDSACRIHDQAYADPNTDRREADHVFYKHATERFKANDATFGERAAALTVMGAMKLKRKMGMGLRKKASCLRKRRKTTNISLAATRQLPIAKRGGFLPLLPTLTALGSLASAASGVVRTVNSLRNKQKTGQGFYLANYKKTTGAGIKKNRKSKHRSK